MTFVDQGDGSVRLGQPQMVEVRMTRQQFLALLSIVMDRKVGGDGNTGTLQWIDVVTGSTVTIEDLLALLSIRI